VLFAPDPPADEPSVMLWLAMAHANDEDRHRGAGPLLAGLIDHSAIMLPHVSHAAIGLLSAVVSRRPAATLRLLDP
jgi:hypothetical protein